MSTCFCCNAEVPDYIPYCGGELPATLWFIDVATSTSIAAPLCQKCVQDFVGLLSDIQMCGLKNLTWTDSRQ